MKVSYAVNTGKGKQSIVVPLFLPVMATVYMNDAGPAFIYQPPVVTRISTVGLLGSYEP